METQAIYDGPDCTVEAIFSKGKFFYTETTYYDEEGNVKGTIKVYNDGSIAEG